MENDLKQSILKTLAYFDVFGYPLTKEELWRLRYGYTDNPDLRMTYADFIRALDGSGSLHGVAERSSGFYFLPGREENVATRQRAVKWFEEKMKIAKRAIKKLRWVPFLRAVFVCNTLAGPGLEKGSDIDVFVVVRKGRLWLARLLATIVLSLFGLRRTKKIFKDRVCLSFYVTDDNLNLSKIALDEDLSGAASAKSDIYLMYWLAQLIPIYDPDNLHTSIQRANQWVKKYLPNAFVPYELSERLRVSDSVVSKFVKGLLERMWSGSYGDLMEKQAREAQKARMKMNYASVQNEPDTRVIVSEQMLKFHENDRRKEYRERWREKCKKYVI